MIFSASGFRRFRMIFSMTLLGWRVWITDDVGECILSHATGVCSMTQNCCAQMLSRNPVSLLNCILQDRREVAMVLRAGVSLHHPCYHGAFSMPCSDGRRARLSL